MQPRSPKPFRDGWGTDSYRSASQGAQRVDYGGSFCIHHFAFPIVSARLDAASDPNTSHARRCGYTMRFMSSRVKLNEVFCGAFHQIYLTRGKDHAGNHYADQTKSYPHLARYREDNGPKGGH